jgi:hypothetical protein
MMEDEEEQKDICAQYLWIVVLISTACLFRVFFAFFHEMDRSVLFLFRGALLVVGLWVS